MEDRKIVGYLEGTDSFVLTELVAKGYETLPLSNGYDGHGKYIGLVTKYDNIAVVIGYLHKVIPLSDQSITTRDMLYSCKVHNIPVILIVPEAVQDNARKILGDIADEVELVDPGQLLDRILNIFST